MVPLLRMARDHDRPIPVIEHHRHTKSAGGRPVRLVSQDMSNHHILRIARQIRLSRPK